MKKETIYGFDIPKRELTQEEKSMNLTVERIRAFHYAAGEDFLDQINEGNAMLFAGFILNKYPDRAKEILNIINENKKYLSIQDFAAYSDGFYEDNEKEDIDGVYFDYCDFINLTTATKERCNQVLIQVTEYYN